MFLALLWPQLRERRAAEEGRHAIVLRDYLLVTRNIDPVALERGRMATMQQGWTPDKTALGLMAYAAFQELATRISHRNTYDLRIHHDEILWPLLRYWKLFNIQGLPPRAEQARARLAAHLAKTDRLASRFEAKRAAQAQEGAS